LKKVEKRRKRGGLSSSFGEGCWKSASKREGEEEGDQRREGCKTRRKKGGIKKRKEERRGRLVACRGERENCDQSIPHEGREGEKNIRGGKGKGWERTLFLYSLAAGGEGLEPSRGTREGGGGEDTIVGHEGRKKERTPRLGTCRKKKRPLADWCREGKRLVRCTSERGRRIP